MDLSTSYTAYKLLLYLQRTTGFILMSINEPLNTLSPLFEKYLDNFFLEKKKNQTKTQNQQQQQQTTNQPPQNNH